MGKRFRQHQHHVHHKQGRPQVDRPADCPDNTCSLTQVACNECVRLVAITGCYTMRQRLVELGLNKGAVVRVVRANNHGPLILAIKDDARMAIGRGMAENILVEPLEESESP